VFDRPQVDSVKRIAVAFGLVSLIGCRPSPLAFTSLDVRSGAGQAIVEAGARSPLRASALSQPPESGQITLARRRWWAQLQWDSAVGDVVFWRTASRDIEWDFARDSEAPRLICWTEWQFSPFVVTVPGFAGPVREQLRLTSGSGGSCGSHSGFVVEHWDAKGIRPVSAEDIPRITAEWAKRDAGQRKEKDEMKWTKSHR
jgi:hypothetical protein